MSSLDATRLMPAPTWSDPRVHLLDDTWLLTIFAILLATALPWLMSGFDIDFAAVAMGLLALGAIHIVFSLLTRPAGERRRRSLLTALHIAGVLVVGFVWMHAGGLQNPLFLMVFVLPVVGAIFLSRWQPYLMALLAIVATAAVALAQAPELRWYAPGLNVAGAWLATVFGQEGAAVNAPFPGFYAPSSYYVVVLEVFAILVFACAVAAEYLGTVFERLHAHVSVARAEAERGQELWASLIEDLPLPALLVDADSSQVLCASEPAAGFCAGEPVGAELFETLHFSYPDVVQELLAGAGGVLPISMMRVADRLRVTEIHVRHIAQQGRRFALLVIHDKTDEFTVKAALDAAEQAALVVDARGCVLTFNKPAMALFAGLQRGADAAQLLSVPGAPVRWWEPGLAGRRKMHIEIAPRVYQVTSSALPLPGEEERLYIATFLPVARSALSDTAISAAVQIADTNATMTNPPLVTR